MNKTKLRCIYFLQLVIFIACISFNSYAKEETSEFIASTDEIVKKYLKNDWFSGNIILKKDDQVLYKKSVGLADIPAKIKNSSETKIRIGSINKHYTAVLILQKVQSGELSLDDTLSQFALGFPENIANKITVRHLLQHKSGFADLFNDEYINTYRSLTDINAKLPLLMQAPLISAPGAEYNYSNYGYIVLGAILEKLEQKPFKQIIENNIFNRIGAHNTHYALTDNVQGKARSYRYNSKNGQKVDKTDILENVTPDGGMYATSEDVALFFSRLFFSDTLLNDKTKAVLGNGYRESSRTWNDILASDKALMSSYGGAPGVSAAAEILMKDQLVVVVLANTDGLVAEKISQEIIAAYRKSVTKG